MDLKKGVTKTQVDLTLLDGLCVLSDLHLREDLVMKQYKDSCYIG